MTISPILNRVLKRAAAKNPDAAGPVLIGPAASPDLHIMSFNIRLDTARTLPGQADHWPERLPALAALLAREAPTAVGVQEALPHQLAAITEAFPGRYRYVGHGRNGGVDGEYSAILYDARRLEVLEWNQFWLSDTPDLPGSATWGNSASRIVTWGRFLDLSTGHQVILVNTHFDHESESSRLRSATAILDLMAGFSPKLPTILTGDFNAPAASAEYEALVSSGVFADAWTSAAQKVSPNYGTFPNYKDPVRGGTRIDWILATPDVSVRQAAINTFTLDGRYPSDHAPVQALVRLPG